MTDPKTALNAVGGAVPDASSSLPNIPAVPNTDNYALNNILSSVKLWIEKATDNGITGFATKSDLVRAGLIKTDAQGNLTSTVDLNLSTPPVPTGLQANGAMTNILVQWDNPVGAYSNHAYTEIWAAQANNFSNAVMVGESSGMFFAHAVGEDTTRYYWIRFVSTAGIKGPFNSLNGTMGQTARNSAYLLSTLTGQITESQLYTTLASRINLIDGSGAGSVNSRIQEEASARAQAILNEASARSSGDQALQTQINTLSAASTGDLSSLMTALQQEQTARIVGDQAEATNRETLAAQLRGSYTGTDPSQLITGLLHNEYQARVAADAAEVTARQALSATVTNNYNTLNSAISSEATTRSTADTTLSNSITSLTSTVNNNNANLTAAINNEATTRANADSSLSTQINTVSARLDSGGDVANAIVQSQTTANTAVTNVATAQAAANNAQTTANSKIKTYFQTSAPTSGMTTGDLWFDSDDNNRAYRYNGTSWIDAADVRISTTASQVTTLQTTVNGHTTSIQTQQTTIDGLSAKYTVKVDNNGYVSGFGLASTANNGTPTSEFQIVADKFSIAPVATDNTAADGSPFFYLTTPTTINGVSIPAGAYMKSAYIHDAAITNAKIANLSADKINAGTLSADRIGANTLTAEKINGNSLVVTNGTFSGTLQAATGTFSGSLSAATGTFAGRLAAGVLDPSSFNGVTNTYSNAGSFTVTVPSNSSWTAVNMRFTLQGAGGGGGGAHSSRSPAAGGGGGAGAAVTVTIANVTPGATYTLVIGTGGSGAYGYANGGNGGNTTFAGYSATGGTGGGGADSGAQYPLPYGAGGSIGGQNGSVYGTPYGGAGGSSAYGAGGAASVSPNPYGVNGNAGGSGAGGSGAVAVHTDNYWVTGGNGGNGYAIIEFFDPNSVVTNVRYSNLITWLDGKLGTVPSNAR